MRGRLQLAAAIAGLAVLAGCSMPPMGKGVQRAGEIATQPVRDVGIAKPEIAPVLLLAAADPYSLHGLKRCPDLRAAIAALTSELGPDYSAG